MRWRLAIEEEHIIIKKTNKQKIDTTIDAVLALLSMVIAATQANKKKKMSAIMPAMAYRVANLIFFIVLLFCFFLFLENFKNLEYINLKVILELNLYIE